MAGNSERRNDNMTPSLTAKSNAGTNNDVVLWADPSTHSLLVTASVAISGGSKTNNAAAPTSDNLGVLPAVASAAAQSYTEGYQVLLSTDLTGALRVTGSLSVGGTTDNSAFTAGSSTGTPAMGFYHSVIDTVTDGRAAAVAITNKRAMYVSLFDASGNALLGSKTSANSIPVVIASDQGSIAVTVGGTVTVTGTVAISGSVAVTQSTTPWVVAGNKTNNSAAPGTANVGTLPAVANAAIPVWVEGNQVGLSVDLSGNARVVQPDVVVAATNITTANLNLNSGAATANSTVATGTLNNTSAVTFQITGTYVGILLLQATVDGSNWVNLAAFTNVSNTTILNGLTSGQTGIFQVDTAGFNKFRVTASSLISGTAVVTLQSTTALGMVGVDTAISLATGAVGTTELIGAGYQERVTDKDVKGLLEQILAQLQTGLPIDPNIFRQLDNGRREVMTPVAARTKLASTVTTITASTAETTIIPGTDGGAYNDLFAIMIANTSASTVCRVDIRDATGGLIRAVVNTVGGTPSNGISFGGMLLPQLTVGGNWTATCGTSTTDIRITAFYVVNT